ncbi:cytosolic carboxypeptidase 3 [Ambystoma mexicanum]|uniref:cytosolic carboxypeptidase 3 n=1 Tax=Ambystoma mexicanum TaxID=8296 RepID=UPI0037E728D1
MSEDSDKEDQLFSQCTSEEVESDEDTFIPFEPEELQQYEYADDICDPCTQRTTQIVFEYQSGRRVRRLREPHSLYGVSSATSVYTVRWPYECEVIEDRVCHIEYSPLIPEPIHRPSGMEREPPYVDPTRGRVVYLVNEANKASCFICSRVGGNQVRPVSTFVPKQVSNNTLVFEARFESGNLQKVIQVGEYDYQLTLRTDLYTDRHTQWFYFRVQNMQAGVPYRFTIVNFTKPSSLYSLGMRPLMYSELEAETHQVGWHRVGDEIKYYCNNIEQDRLQYYSLSWKCRFRHHNDTCYFAHCYPYTYSNLQSYLADIANDPERSKFCKIRVLCHSLARNMVYVLTITNPSTSGEELKRKKAVILTARVHPGETNSSWIMKGFLDYILSNRDDACLLRDTFIFKVVPMLNPDGVIVGNYRCSLAGRDLNRNYRSILKDSFPSVWCTRNMIKRVMEEREVLLYCDLHGHSRKQNVFMYGCGIRGSTESTRLKERVFPLMLHKNSPDKFSFLGCKFKVQKSKEGTGRVVMWRMGISNSYTMEVTFCGSSLGGRRGTHFSTKDLESMGYHFCDALLDYCDPDQAKFHHCLKELEDMEKKRTKGILGRALSDSDTSLVDGEWDLESSTEGSDSSESNDLPAHLLDMASKGKGKKKRLKTKKDRNSCIVHLGMASEEISKETQGDSRTHQENPSIDNTLCNLGSKNRFLSSQMHTRHRENIDDLEKMQISNLNDRSFLNDLSGKKVSLVYLFFDANGDVITKSQSSLQKQNIWQVNHGLKEFSWINPHSQTQDLLSRKPFYPTTRSQSTTFRHSYCIDGKARHEHGPTACLLEKVGDVIEEAEEKKSMRVKKPALSALRPIGKQYGIAGKPQERGSHLSKMPVPSLLCEQPTHNLMTPRRTHGSAPIYPANMDECVKSSGNQHRKEINYLNLFMDLRNKGERTRNRDTLLEEKGPKILGKLELSLPAVPGASVGLRNGQMTLPNSLDELIPAAASGQQIHLSQRELGGSSHQRSGTSTLPFAQQKAFHGGTLFPRATGDVAENNDRQTSIPVTKYTKRTWKNILQVLESHGTEATLENDTSNKHDAYTNPSSFFQRATDAAEDSI